MEKDWNKFQDQHLFSREDLSQSLLKLCGLQKGPLLPLFRQQVEITATFDVSALCAVGDVQYKTRTLP